MKKNKEQAQLRELFIEELGQVSGGFYSTGSTTAVGEEGGPPTSTAMTGEEGGSMFDPIGPVIIWA